MKYESEHDEKQIKRWRRGGTAPELPPRSAGFRPDIDGIRALAILMVVAYHAEVPGFDGGFTGVDVFFVISGYLITRNVLRDAGDRGRVELGEFWARRVRRLVPALALVVVTTMIASAIILSSSELTGMREAGTAAALYVSNFHYASQTQGYFAADVSLSPFLHTWSLGVEEQFYLVWPLLLGAIIFGVRSRPGLLRRALLGVFAVLIGGSLLLCYSVTASGSTWAFYGLPTRAWEFAAAGVLAATGSPRWTARRWVRVALGSAGMVLLGLAVVGLSSRTPYPGTAALLPVSGTLLLLLAGERTTPMERPTLLARLLRAGPLQRIGQVSYSWYLWHWPFIVLTVVAVGSDTVTVRAAAAAVALPVAWLAFTLVENPIRFGSFARPNRRTFAIGTGLTGLALGSALGVPALTSALPTTELETQLEQVSERFFPACSTGSTRDVCFGGDLVSEQVVLLVGDSHAQTWFNAFAATGERRGFRVALVAAPACVFADVEIRALDPARAVTTPATCRAVRATGHELIDELSPTVVVIIQANLYLKNIVAEPATPGPADEIAEWTEALEEVIAGLRRDGVVPAMILDNPTLPADPNTCLRLKRSIPACEVSRSEALRTIEPLRAAELSVVGLLDVPHFSPTDQICDEEVCRLGTDDYLFYSDSNHLSHRATMGMQTQVEALLDRALAQVVGAG